ncbi:Mg/Co/Ni transporter MgtE, CBS domain-containing [hydrothermal vent metagenome]|uniref:Mg/Co/Ni transporter MgtE, CBS domain-containing n=1 Tax=hydrothermal vent metagenome TaxID=652676 RepID=A0A3B0Z7J0_9ZZZZ
MPEVKEHERNIARVEALTELLHKGSVSDIRSMLDALHPSENALLLESLPVSERESVWQLMSLERKGQVLVRLNCEVRPPLIKPMAPQELAEATKGLDLDDLVDFLQDLPDSVIRQVLYSFDVHRREQIKAVLAYPEDSAGGLMNIDTVSVRADITLGVVVRYLRWQKAIPENTDSLMVIDRTGRYLGVLPLIDLLIKSPDLHVLEVYNSKIEGIPATMPESEVAKLFEHRDFISAPVIDEYGRLLGRITVDDVVDVIRDGADHSFMSMAGLSDESDVFAPVIASSRRRAVWLGVNLLTAFLAAWVIGLFEATIEKLVVLAVLMPVVASMGGIAGSQTLTLVIRGMALGQVGDSNARRLLAKEFAVGVVNGVVWALVVSAVVIAWFDDVMLGTVIGTAILINLMCAALAGVTIPLVLRRMDIDPALAGGVILTTVTDVIGFLTFLGLAALLLV